MTEKAKCKYCTDEIDGSGDICDHCEACVAQEKHGRKYMRNRHAWGILFSLILLLFCVNKLLMPDYDNWVLYITGFAVFSLGFQIHQFFVCAGFVYEEYDPWDGMADELNKGS